MPKIAILAGEASGDLIGSQLMGHLNKKIKNVKFVGVGGPLMKKEGLTSYFNYSELSIHGYFEAYKNFFYLLSLRNKVIKYLLKEKPKIFIGIDLPDFNFTVEKILKENNIKTFHYVAPSVWAWRKNRIFSIKNNINHLFTVFPHEPKIFKKAKVPVTFVGHPLLDELTDSSIKSLETEKPVIALLPGSRRQEIKKMLPLMMELADHFTDYQFIIAGAPSIPSSFYRSITGDSYLPISTDKTYEVLKVAKAAVITSGTATLEAAILQVPQVVCYRTSRFSYWIGKQLIKVPFISLVNLILNKQVVTELVQADFNKERLIQEIDKLLNKKHRIVLLQEYLNLIEELGEKGASQRAAQAVFKIAEIN